MIAVFTEADAAVIVAVVTLVAGPLVAVWLRVRQADKTSQAEHAGNIALGQARAEKLDRIIEVTTALHADVLEIKSDVREVKADVRDHGVRLRAIESPKPTPRKRAAS